MSLTPINHVHGVLHIIVGATGNNSLISISEDFYWLSWKVPCMGLKVPFAPYLLVFFSFCRYCNYLFRVTRSNKVDKTKQNNALPNWPAKILKNLLNYIN